MEIEERIENFIKELEETQPKGFQMGYDYIEEMEMYDIWHNSLKLDFEEDDRSATRDLFNKYFKITENIAMGYDFDKFILSKKDTKFMEEM